MVTKEALGPAERILQTVLTYSDHMQHNRPGLVVAAPGTPTGVAWTYASYKAGADGAKTVFRLTQVAGKKGKPKQHRTPVGTLRDDGTVWFQDKLVGRYQPPGLLEEVAVWLYRQIAEVWKLDNAFAARWASYAFRQTHTDLKVALAAFMLVQSRKGAPVLEDGKLAFFDEDYRDVGEAMLLLREKGHDLNPRLLFRVRELLRLPAIAAVNRELGFGHSARTPFLGRWPVVVERYLRHLESNPPILKGLVNAGFRRHVMRLAQVTSFRPETAAFFQALRWKQTQAEDGRRQLAVDAAVGAAESWAGLTEAEICQRIATGSTLSWHRITSLLPPEVGMTRAVVASAIEAKRIPDKQLVIMTPTLEALGLLEVQEVRTLWERATRAATDMRAANIARNVKTKAVVDVLEAAADKVLKDEIGKAVEEADYEVWVAIDISASMQNALEAALSFMPRFVQGFPLDRLKVCVFNSIASGVEIKHASKAGVENAFAGKQAGGGTAYEAAVRYFANLPRRGDPTREVVMIWIGDERNHDQHADAFADTFQAYKLKPAGFGLIRLGNGIAVQKTAEQLGIPCLPIDERIFADPYAIPRTLRALIASTPTAQVVADPVRAPRLTLVEQILNTDLLTKPAWALAA